MTAAPPRPPTRPPPLGPRPRAPERLTVSVEETRYASPDGRFAVVEAQALGRPGEPPRPVVLVGELGHPARGETLRVEGHVEEHPTHGRRFRVAAFTPVVPETRAGLARYLGSGLVSGVGEALAQRIVERFGDGTLDVIAHDAGRLTEVEGIGTKRARAIAETVRGRLREAETRAFLHGLGLGPALVRRVLQRFGDDAVRVLRENPYEVAERVSGVGFRTADRLGRAAGIASDDPRRARAAALHLLRTASDHGHVFLPAPQLAREAAALGVPSSAVAPSLHALEADGRVVLEGEAVYRAELHAAEVEVAARLAARARAAPPEVAGEVAPALLGGLSDEQAAAVRASLSARLFVLTGGPGTGKTTTVRALVAAHEAVGRRVLLCAPTGRAAKRLSDATGRPAATIHRALEWSPAERAFARDESRPFEVDLVLVDEASMLDLVLARHLLRAVPDAAHLVWVGDVDQLPPVSPGPVLRELLASGVGRVARLAHVFRQAEESAIVRGAHAILGGRFPETSPPRRVGPGDLHFVPAPGDDSVADRVVRIVERTREGYGLDPGRDVQVLSPMRKGPAGTLALNAALRRALNPRAREATAALAPGDRVMQLVNDYDRGVFNGDLGEVTHVEAGTTFVRVDDREVVYDADAAESLTLAYASTVHKVQGSEFPAVVVVATAAHHVMLSRPLIYTALTRARRLAVLAGERAAFERAIQNARSAQTHARLAERLRRDAR